jgi:hypothetical protein
VLRDGSCQTSLVNQPSPHAQRFASRWPIPCYAPPPTVAHMLRNVAGKPNLIREVGSLCATVSGSSHAQQ